MNETVLLQSGSFAGVLVPSERDPVAHDQRLVEDEIARVRASNVEN